jgi:hypothetical protein
MDFELTSGILPTCLQALQSAEDRNSMMIEFYEFIHARFLKVSSSPIQCCSWNARSFIVYNIVPLEFAQSIDRVFGTPSF